MLFPLHVLVFKNKPRRFFLRCLLTLCVCGDLFNLQHALSCPKGELVVIRYNELRNLTPEILGEVCKNVVIKSLLTPITGEELPKSSNTSNQARADASARVLKINRQTVFCDVRVFNPLVRCHLHHSLPAVHKKNENERKWEYNQWILQVEHGWLIPLAFSCFGWMSRGCSRFFSHTTKRLANRRKEPKSKISAWIKARPNFALTWSMLLCLHGPRTPSNVDNIGEIDLCVFFAENNIDWITYRFISCYIIIINMYGYIFIRSLFRYFCVYTQSSDATGLIFHAKLTVCFISYTYAGFMLLKNVHKF